MNHPTVAAPWFRTLPLCRLRAPLHFQISRKLSSRGQGGTNQPMGVCVLQQAKIDKVVAF